MRNTYRWTFAFVIGICLILSCGADIGNPELSYVQISGNVQFSNDERASDAKVIIGRYSDQFIDENSVDTISQGGVTYIIRSRFFDTIACDKYGKFIFDSAVVGQEYVLVAQKQHKNGMERVIALDSDKKISIKIGDPAHLTIRPYSDFDSTKPAFIAARICGTPYFAKADSQGVIYFDSVPSVVERGIMDIALEKNNKGIDVFKNFEIDQGINATLLVDPARTPDCWTAKTSPRQYNDRPYVLRCGLSGDTMLTVKPENYDLYVQFSSEMDTYLTSKALNVRSLNSTIQIDTLWWQGSDMVFVRLCAKDSAGVCSRSLIANSRPWVVTVDTTAEAKSAKHMAWPEIITLQK